MKMLLNGKKVGTEGREEIIVINPYTHEEIDRVPCADLNDIDTALECAREGAEKWGRVPVLERVRILEKVSSKIAEKKKDIALLLSKEAGKIYTHVFCRSIFLLNSMPRKLPLLWRQGMPL